MIHLDLLGHRVTLGGGPGDLLGETFADVATRDDGGDPEATVHAAPGPDGSWSIEVRGAAVSSAQSDPELLDVVAATCTRLALDLDADNLHLHAGLVDRDGSGVVICGPSGAGKSTLTAALVASGCAYLSDEMVTLTAGSGVVRAFPKPIGLEHAAVERFGGHGPIDTLAASQIGHVGSAAVADVIVFPRRQEGVPLRATELAPHEAVHRMIDQLLDGARYGGTALDVLAELATRTSAWELNYDDVDEAVPVVMQLARPATPSTFGAAWPRTDDRPGCVVGSSTIEGDMGTGTFLSEPAAARIENPLRRSHPADPRIWSVTGSLSTLVADLAGANELFLWCAPASRPGGQDAPTILVTDLGRLRSIPRPEGLRADALVDVEGLFGPVTDAFDAFRVLWDAHLPCPVERSVQAGLHPRHELLRRSAAVTQGADDALRLLVDATWLPPRVLDASIADAERLGLLPTLIRSVSTAASVLPGTAPHLTDALHRAAVRLRLRSA